MDYRDLSTRKLKRAYWRAIKTAWGLKDYSKSEFPHWAESEFGRACRERDQMKAELTRRGWPT